MNSLQKLKLTLEMKSVYDKLQVEKDSIQRKKIRQEMKKLYLKINSSLNFNITATTAKEFQKQLDELTYKLEESDLIEKFEEELNELLNKQAELMKQERL